MLEFYTYKNCSTCTSARKALAQNGVSFREIELSSNPPTVETLKRAMKGGLTLRQLLNTSGKLYREMNLSEKVKVLPEAEVLHLLSKNGMLVKRPLVIGKNRATAGFREAEFLSSWK